MKRTIQVFLASAFLAVVVIVAMKARAAHASTSTVISEIDREKLKRVDAQISVLQIQAQAQFDRMTAPMIAEKTQIAEKYCKPLKIAVEKCDLNTVTGEVTAHKDPPPPPK